MSSYALAFAALGIIVLLGSWREYTSDNRRDAKLLAAVAQEESWRVPPCGWSDKTGR